MNHLIEDLAEGAAAALGPEYVEAVENIINANTAADAQAISAPSYAMYPPSEMIEGQYTNLPSYLIERTITCKPKERKVSKKKRKSMKSTGRWTDEEHAQFVEGVNAHGRNCTEIATFVKTRTTLQVRTHAQKYFSKLDHAQSSDPLLARNEITSPVAAQTLLGMSKMKTSGPTGTLHHLNLVESNKSPPNRCRYRDCTKKMYKGTGTCLRHQNQICTFPSCGNLVEEDVRFSQKRELCKDHYSMLTNRSRSLFSERSERP